jgi:hypothetical protein
MAANPRSRDLGVQPFQICYHLLHLWGSRHALLARQPESDGLEPLKQCLWRKDMHC